MAAQDSFQYDAFISCHQADQEWVYTFLLPRLEADQVRVVTSVEDFEGGGDRARQTEKAILNSRCTVAIITPAWLHSHWNDFEIALSQTLSLADLKRKVIPVLLQPCEIPARLRHLVAVDLTNEKRREQRVRKLAQDIFGRSYAPAPALPRRSENWRAFWSQVGRWLRRNRRRVRWISALAGISLVLLLMLLLQIGPFHPAPGWSDLGFRGQGANVLARVGDSLLVSSDTEQGTCSDAIAMWRSSDAGANWTPISTPDLCIDMVQQGQQLAAVRAFAPTWSPAHPGPPSRLYGVTSDIGVITSSDAGASWQTTPTQTSPPDPKLIAASFSDPNLLLVTPSDKAGVYRSRDGGASFEQLDGTMTCTGATGDLISLPSDLIIGAMAATETAFIVGTSDADRRNPGAGLYLSRDGGDCWQLIEASEDTWGYEAVAQIPQRPDEIMVAVEDGTSAPGQTSDFLYRYNIAAGFSGRRRLTPPLWTGKSPVSALFVSADEPPLAYLASEFWAVVHYGPIERPVEWDRTTPLLSCLECEVRLAPDVRGARPLLLADERVFRWNDNANLLQRWWP